MPVNKAILILFALVLLCCSCQKTEKDRNAHAVNIHSDSLYYDIEISGARKNPSTFLVTKGIYINGHLIGGENDENIQKAFQYRKENKIAKLPYIKYSIQRKTGDNYAELWTIKDMINTNSYVELLQGVSVTAEGANTAFLKITRRETGNLNSYAANFQLHNNHWTLLSKERIITDSLYHKKVGYCIDTKNKKLNYSSNREMRPENEIDFSVFDDIPDTFWKCN
jgi:hypothetical protein